MSFRHLDDVALREIFKKVDAATLQRCRRVCRNWNTEIIRLNRFTRKFTFESLLIQLSTKQFTMSVNRKSLELSNPDPVLITNSLRHVSPPRSLNFLIQNEVNLELFERMMHGFNVEWCSEVKELDISTQSETLSLSIMLNKFPNLTFLSLSSYWNENAPTSCAEIFKKFPQLQDVRLYNFNEDGRGLLFDDYAVQVLLENQKEGRKIRRMEFYNMDIKMSIEKMTEALQKLANLDLRVFPDGAGRFLEIAEEIHFLFHNCHWEQIKELHLLNSIISISSDVDFPIPQDSYENILKGDFRFRISGTRFVLKFIV